MRTLRLRIDPSGQVIVSAPEKVPHSVIMSFLLQHNYWVNREKEKIKLRQALNPVLDWDRGIVSFFGRLYTFKFDPKCPARVTLGQNFIYVNPVTQLASHVKRTLLRFLEAEAKIYLTQRTTFIANAMNTRFKALKFRQQKSRWGSCTPDNRLSFNWRLIHFKKEIIDYVVIHELAHTLHHNHSARFWSVVKKYDPTYKQKVKFLRSQIIPLEKT